MRGGLSPARATAPGADALQAQVDAELDARLDRTSPAPVALGLSGGGDSLALLRLAADWCARAGRPLLALTVDHGLHPAGAAWTARAGRMAAAAGARWRALAWDGAKPAAGLPAAGRRARHALLATAAREAGACVLLLAHTADDVAETEALRLGDAPGIGRLRAWAPSPAWPEGRGVVLLRPLLNVSRGVLRDRLRAGGLDWIEDPANADRRFARARLRAAGVAPGRLPPPEPPGFGEALPDGRVRLARAALAGGAPGARRSLAAAIACAGGGEGARGRALAALQARLAGAAPVDATLAGARVRATAGAVEIGREPGRTPPADLALAPGAVAVWDGRFEASAAEAGWAIGCARGRLSRLPPAERAGLRSLPAVLRGGRPVFLREGEARLLPPGATLRALGPARFDAAIGRIGSEAELRRA